MSKIRARKDAQLREKRDGAAMRREDKRSRRAEEFRVAFAAQELARSRKAVADRLREMERARMALALRRDRGAKMMQKVVHLSLPLNLT